VSAIVHARIAPRSLVVAGALAALLLALLVIAVGTGEFAIAPREVVATLLGAATRARAS
jgi:ABC-type enterobactin transport system permease subunit